MLVFILMFACANNPKSGDSSFSSDLEDSGEIITVSNAGPDGDAIAQQACGADDSPYFLIIVNPLTEECDASVNMDWSVELSIFEEEILSGQTYSIGNASSGTFWYEGSRSATDGEFFLSFDGAWADGVTFTGYYWMESDDMPLIEGGFSGFYCESEFGCG